jgi:hypothetical protein
MERIFFCLLVMIASVAYAQSDKAQKLMQFSNNVERFACKYPQERVYLHFDNTSYYKGEHIWYKANVVRGDNLHATPLSRILYVELVSPIGFPVETQKLVIENGQAHGSFLLKDTLNAGFYEVRAYTSWMLNFTPGEHHGWRKFTNRDYRDWLGDGFQNYLKGNAGIFSRVFPVYDAVEKGKYGMKTMIQPPKTTSEIEGISNDGLTIKFYPEGGNFVMGVPTRIAFEAKNAYGKGVSVNGAIMHRNDTIGNFSSIYGGKGLFTIIPDSDNESMEYGLYLKTNYDGKNYKFNFPHPQRHGVVLNVTRRQGNVIVTVQRNKETKVDTLGLMISCRGDVAFFDTINMRDHLKHTEIIEQKDLNTGVNIVILYDSNGTIMAQRELFVNNHNQKYYRIDNDCSSEDQLKPYQKMNLQLQLKDSIGNAIRKKETFSLSVVDDKYHDESYYDGNIMTDLLLSSELKGFIPYPSYYFEKDDESHLLALDLLMMVQGWSRYDFHQMAIDTTFQPRFKIERNITFSGRIFNTHYLTDRISVIQRGVRQDVDSRQGFGNTTDWDLPKNEIWLDTEMPHQGNTLRGELQTHDKGFFDYYIPAFYGKRYAYIMMNRKSIEELGAFKGGISGHLLKQDTRIDRSLENKYVISPLIAYPPLAKPYEYYETETPSTDDDLEFVNSLKPIENVEKGKIMRYDKQKGGYILRTIVKKSHRKWKKQKEGMPILDVDIQDLMTYLSCITGRLQSFNLGVFSSLNVTSPIRYFFPEIMGISGHMRLSINGHSLPSSGTLVGSHYVYGYQDYVPKGKEALPLVDDFSRLRIYADVRNRELLYTTGRYGESIEYSEQQSEKWFPMTVRMDFVTDSTRREKINSQFFTGNRIMIQGISQPDEFYSPDYSKVTLPSQKDFRRTVYWNPDVRTDENGHANVSFYNNSFSKLFVISAEGITRDGIPLIYKK